MSNIISKFKESKNYKYENPICTYETLGKTPLDNNLNKNARWLEFKGYLNYNAKSGRWSISIRNKDSLDYSVAKYGSKNLKEILEKLKTKCFREFDYIRNVKLNNSLITKLLEEIEKEEN